MTEDFLRGMVPNDILAVWVVAVTLGIVVVSERTPSDPGQCDVRTDGSPDSRGVACGRVAVHERGPPGVPNVRR